MNCNNICCQKTVFLVFTFSLKTTLIISLCFAQLFLGPRVYYVYVKTLWLKLKQNFCWKISQTIYDPTLVTAKDEKVPQICSLDIAQHDLFVQFSRNKPSIIKQNTL